jgi:hypothetical protein
MSTALYYPHSRIENEALVKTSLVLFDRVEWIAPDDNYEPKYDDPRLKQAMKIIEDRHIPNDQEKELAHAHVERLVSQPLPDWFVFKPTEPETANDFRYPPYEILPDKFLTKTWDLLQGADFVSRSGEPAKGYKHGEVFDYQTSPAMGLTLMGILAHVCAGATKRGITDQADSYAALMHYFMENGGFDCVEPGQQGPNLTEYERLITISFKTIDDRPLPLKRLIALRKRERDDGDSVLKEARTEYFKRLDYYANQVATQAKFPSDQVTIEKEFQSEMEGKLAALKRELKIDTKRVLLSKEMVGAVVALAGIALLPAAAPILTPALAEAIGIGVLGLSVTDAALLEGKRTDYKAKREDKIKANPMGWLYFSKPFRIY